MDAKTGLFRFVIWQLGRQTLFPLAPSIAVTTPKLALGEDGICQLVEGEELDDGRKDVTMAPAE